MTAFIELQEFIEAIATPVLILHNRIHIKGANSLAQEMFNTSEDELIGYPLLNWVPNRFHSTLSALSFGVLNIQIRCQTGQLLNVTLTVKPKTIQGDLYSIATFVPAHQMEGTHISTDDLTIGVYRTRPDGTYLYANRALAQMLGCDSVEELLTHNAADFYRSEGARQEHIYSAQMRANLSSRENQISRKDGTPLWVKDTARIVYDVQGNINYFEGTLEDIGEKRRAEAAKQEQRQLIEGLLVSSTILSSTLQTDVIMELVLEIIGHVVPHDAANIMQIDHGGARIVHHKGYPPEIADSIKGTPISLELPTLQTMIDTGDTLLINDTRKDEMWWINPEQSFTISYLGVPIQTSNQIMGFINLGSTTPYFFTDDHSQRLLAFANQVAIAMENAWLYEQAQQEIFERKEVEQQLQARNQELEALNAISRAMNTSLNLKTILNELLKHLKILVPYDSANIVLVDDGNLQHLTSVDMPADLDEKDIINQLQDAPTIKGVIQSGSTQIIMDTKTDTRWVLLKDIDYRVRSWMGVPIFSQGELLGILNLDKSEPEFYTEAHAEKALSVAQQAAIGIENAHLYERLQAYNNQLIEMVDERTNQLELETRRLEAVLDATGEGIFYMEDYRFQYANPEFTLMVGYTVEELTNKPFSLLKSQVLGEDQSLEASLQQIEQGRSRREELRLRRKDGSEFYASLTFTQLAQSSRQVARLVAVARDVSVERDLQEKRSNFIANAAHELRNPLTSFDLRLHMLRRKPENLEPNLDKLEQINRHVMHLVEELMDITRFERGIIQLNIEKVVVQDLIQQTIDTQELPADEKGLSLTCDMPDMPVYAQVDLHRILQVLINLVSNAIHYTPAEGTVHLKLCQNKRKDVLIEVHDSGQGIPPEYLPDLIFEPFQRANIGDATGTGLGLTISKEIVTAHGGSIHVESEIGTGTTFHVCLPSEPSSVDAE